MITKIEQALIQLRQIKPDVLCLTNYVTMDFVANSLLALGAAPIMSCDEREMEELVKISHAVNINIGTLDPEFIKRSQVAAKLANHYNKPLILDPVGAGASSIRTIAAQDTMKFADIIRGNASEIMSHKSQTLGVEATQSVESAQDTANTLARSLECAIVISGKVDFVTDGSQQKSLNFGSPVMKLVTGMGCALTAVIAAFKAVIPDSFEASVIATAYFGLCGSLTHEKTNKPGSFRSTFIDELYEADFQTMRKFDVK